MLADRLNTAMNVGVAATLVGIAGYYCNDFINNFDKMDAGVGAAILFGGMVAAIIGFGLLVIDKRV